MDFLKIKDKTFLISGVANKKSVAFFTAKEILENGGKVVLSVQNEKNYSQAQKLFPDDDIFLLDVNDDDSLINFGNTIKNKNIQLDGILHSIAFANYSEGPKPFLKTLKKDFLEATNISCFSLVSLTNSVRESLNDDASIVTVSISSTKATNYGYMGPIKAALDSTVSFLAKSLSDDSRIRVNAVCSGPLKTSASAGIPGYIENYLFAEKLTMRHEALKTKEVADTICYLLSPRSSGINASGVVVDAGMSSNYFDESVVY